MEFLDEEKKNGRPDGISNFLMDLMLPRVGKVSWARTDFPCVTATLDEVIAYVFTTKDSLRGRNSTQGNRRINELDWWDPGCPAPVCCS